MGKIPPVLDQFPYDGGADVRELWCTGQQYGLDISLHGGIQQGYGPFIVKICRIPYSPYDEPGIIALTEIDGKPLIMSDNDLFILPEYLFQPIQSFLQREIPLFLRIHAYGHDHFIEQFE